MDDLKNMKSNEIGTITEKELNNVISRVVNEVKPEKIILFGSYAYGQPNRESDLDLLVVCETDLPPRKRALAIRRCFWKTGIPVDVIVHTPDEYERLKNDSNSFVGEIHRKGKVLYGR